MIFPRAPLKRSSRTRARKDDSPADTDVACPSPRSSVLARPKTRPPPLQIISESSEREFDIDAAHSPATARPIQSSSQPDSMSSRITLSAYTFSIDDALLMFGDDTPRSPALSASSSTSDSASSENVPTTPGASDDENGYDFMLPTPRLPFQHISVRPLCITKTRSLICQDDEDVQHCFEKAEKVVSFPVTKELPWYSIETKAAVEAVEEAEWDFYTREFEGFISFPTTPSPTFPARRDSLVLVAELLSAVVKAPEPKPRGRSRHSKPLPLLPPATPPASSLPPISSLHLRQTTVPKSIVRRKRNIPSQPNFPPPPTQVVPRPLPRMGVPFDIEDCLFPEEDLDVPSREPIITARVHDVEEDAKVHSQSSSAYTVSASACPLSPAIPETPLSGMYGEAALPRSSTDSDAPRSSVDSTSSFTSSTSSNTPESPFSFPSSPSSEERLRSRWSSSTLGSLAAEPSRGTTLLSPLKSVLSSRARRIKTSPRLPLSKSTKNKYDLSTTPSPPSTIAKHIRRQGSQSSTSSSGKSPCERDNCDGSPSGLKRKPIPVVMFLRGG